MSELSEVRLLLTSYPAERNAIGHSEVPTVLYF